MYQNSKLVWAARYKLTEPISVKNGVFNTKGGKKLMFERLVNRAYAVKCNKAGLMFDDQGKEIEGRRSNNEIYLIDEEKTAKLMALRDENIIKNAEKKRKESLGQSDLVDAIKGLTFASENKSPSNGQTTEVKKDSPKLVDLRKYCDDNGIEYHHKAGEKKLQELIEEHKS